MNPLIRERALKRRHQEAQRKDLEWWNSLTGREQRNYLADSGKSKYDNAPLKPLKLGEEKPKQDFDSVTQRKIRTLQQEKKNTPSEHIETRDHLQQQIKELRNAQRND